MLKLYNTLTRKVEDFTPIEKGKVNLFVCGPTVYDFSPISHAKTYIHMDILARTLKLHNYEVFYLQNITDIDDKIIARAKEQGIDWQTLSRDFEAKYLEDMERISITTVTQYARATDHIGTVIKQVQVLLDKGHAYTTDDGIYFEVATFPKYGKLSGRTEVQENDAQTRIDQNDQKRGWNDFCLWKFSKPGEPLWDAPFGKGRPGWHIEDTAITEHFFGPQYDIHGGAIDLIFPHHEAEITQMEAASGKRPFVQFWVHGGFLTIDSKRMGKSLNNFYTIREVLKKGYDPMAIRVLMMQSHYRSSVDFTWPRLDAATNRLASWQSLADLMWQANQLSSPQNIDFSKIKQSIKQKLGEDLNTPQAITELDQLADKLTTLPPAHLESLRDFLNFVDTTFGLNLGERSDITDEQKEIITRRQDARQLKEWARSDELRNQLASQGVGIRDTDDGPVWYRENVI